MISRLEEALAHNRRFSADVSHELRTPLTILRGELEHVIQMRNAGPDVVESVGSALEEIERLAKIVESLLAYLTWTRAEPASSSIVSICRRW